MAYLSNAVVSEKSLIYFQAHIVLKPLVSLITHLIASSARISVDTQTHKPTTVTLAAHAHRRLRICRCHILQLGSKNVSNFIPFRFVELPFPFETLIYRWNSFRSVAFHLCRTCVRVRAVIREMRMPHCEDISSSTCVGTAFSLLRVCAKKKPCFALPLASLYRVCGRHVTRNSQLNGNGTERY